MATIAEKSRTKEIIDRLQSVLNNASPVPLAAGKVTIYKDEVQSLLDELAMQIEAELKTYHEVNDRRGKIINEAKKEAEKIIYQAEHSASRMRVSKRATNVIPVDYSEMEPDEIDALDNAHEIYAASLIYTDEMMTEVSKVIEDAYHNIRNDYEIVLQAMEEKMNTILNNKNELMSGLQEMDAVDHSQQILEIGQLLSNELYNERMKKRMDSDEYDDGSVQLSLDLQVEQAEENARAAQEMAKQTAEALEQMTAERNALMETVMQMERAQVEASRKTAVYQTPQQQAAPQTAALAQPTAAQEAVSAQVAASEQPVAAVEKAAPAWKVTSAQEAVPAQQAAAVEKAASAQAAASAEEEDVEYEIVYVTEDELEEGEEYEIEYVDDDEFEDGSEYESAYVEEKRAPESAEKTVTSEKKAKETQQKGEAPIEKTKETSEQTASAKKAPTENVKETPEQAASAEKAPAENVKEAAGQAASTEKASAENVKAGQKGSAGAEQPVKKETGGKRNRRRADRREKKQTDTENKEVKEAIRDLEELAKETEEMPVIPHFKSSEKVASAPSEQIAKMAQAVTTEKKYSGLIGRAVANREKQEAAVSVEEDAPMETKDEDIRTDAKGNQYVQATMKFDDDFEIMEF